ncbi:MAG: hypothetical protein K5641_00720 [Lachnospiraceae bacterium]|nr:hypothetical protein [Lachnospiraceae bacterium]
MIKEQEQQINKITTAKGAKQLILLGSFLSFFAILWYLVPLGIFPDSGSYIAMQNGREPLYPMFLAFFRRVFHEGDTLEWLAASGQLDSEKGWHFLNKWPALHVSTFLQSLLAGYGCYRLFVSVRKVFHTKLFLSILVGLATLIPYVLTPLASASGMMLNKAVLTEGLAFPFYYLFIAALIRGVFADQAAERDGQDGKTFLGEKVRAYALALFYALLLVLTRNQMLVALGLWCLCMLWEIVCAKTGKGRILTVALLLVCVFGFFGLRSGANEIYNRNVHAGYRGTDTGSYNLLTTAIYLTNPDDITKIEDVRLQALFQKMYNEADTRKLTSAYAGSGLLTRAYHYEDCYDAIGLEIQQPILFGDAADRGVSDDDALNEVVREANAMVHALAPALFGRYIVNYVCTCASGFTRSIAASGTMLGFAALVFYAAAIILTALRLKKDRKDPRAWFMVFALAAIVVNVCATSLMIMCLSRYMIYNIALFYIAGAVLVFGRKERKPSPSGDAPE